MRKILLLIALSFVSLSAQPISHRTVGALLTVDSISRKVDAEFKEMNAFETLKFFTHFWRIGGGPAFDTCIEFLENKLKELKRTTRNPAETSDSLTYSVLEEYTARRTRVPFDAELSMAHPLQQVLHCYANTPVMLCSNSFAQDFSAPLVRVHGGDEAADFGGLDVANKVVFCDAQPFNALPLALAAGARGIVSSFVPKYNHPELHPDIISESGISYDDRARSFAVKVSPKTAAHIDQLLLQDSVNARIRILSTFVHAPINTLVAEIPGSVRPEQHVLIAAHLDHYRPGANDNASGASTLLEIVRSISTLIDLAILPPPARTVTFLWVQEYSGTTYWIKQNPFAIKNTLAAFVLDIGDGDPSKIGGIFRIERMPDPAVMWTRKPDGHSG